MLYDPIYKYFITDVGKLKLIFIKKNEYKRLLQAQLFMNNMIYTYTSVLKSTYLSKMLTHSLMFCTT